ncbi:MAG: thiamine biosynthesis protein, partial [Desulfobulbaceae bacterium]|nr:thiamine biosynthesis protein [Desulfobulbaceae bacterium]
MTKKQTTALALFSGGLDSIVSCRVMMEQGIQVKAVTFVTPFFGYELLAQEQDRIDEVRTKYGIDLILRDVSEPYIKMLRNPPHGYGKNFNPCIDCKILLFTEARKMMPEFNASFLISGEVIGQRPMSQRRDT